MFDAKIIHDLLKEYVINQGITQIAIFPFGENGEIVRSVLINAFHVVPVALVDNNREGDDIVTLSEFCSGYQDGCYVVLTVESRETHSLLRKCLCEFVLEHAVIDLLEYHDLQRDVFHNRLKRELAISNLFPSDRDGLLRTVNDTKIKVRIVHSRVQTWNSISSICEAVYNDVDMDLLLIIGWDRRKECENQARRNGYRHVWWKDYCVDDDYPDVLVLSQPYDAVTWIPGIRESAKLIIVANTLLIRNTMSLSRFYEIQKQGFDRFEPDYFLCDSLLFSDIRESYNLKARLVEMGNAKFDGIYNSYTKKHLPNAWRKLEGKRIIVWATDHGIYTDNVQHTTFDLYASTFFEYFSNNDDMGLIVRPHQDLVDEIVRAGIWTEGDVKSFIEHCDNSNNIIYDNSETYDSAFSVSDAIITDNCCGITVSALPTGKPICILQRTSYEQPYHPELAKHYYKAFDTCGIVRFLSMIRMGRDPMRDERQAVSKRFIKSFDGKNGERIKDFIKQEYYSMMP